MVKCFMVLESFFIGKWDKKYCLKRIGVIVSFNVLIWNIINFFLFLIYYYKKLILFYVNYDNNKLKLLIKWCKW